ncbi:MAG: hypothetical protein ABIO43_10985 [Sphingomicrobium sp.]
MIDFEVLAAFAILGLMMVLAFKGGRNNPVTTGRLANDLHKTKNKLMVIAKELEEAATKADLEALRLEITGSATSVEVKALSDKVTTVCTKVDGIEKAADRTEEAVQRIEGFLIKKALGS